MQRRRALAFALFLVSFVGPWGMKGGHGPPSAMYFPELAEDAFTAKRDWLTVLVVAMMALPGACLVVLVSGSSRAMAVVYRVLVVGVTAVLLFALVESRLSLEDIRHEWGVHLYVLTVIFASVTEFVPSRKAPQRDYVEPFR